MDEEDEYEEEECFVLVELSGIIDNDFLHSCEEKCKILGIETSNPVLQLGHYVFKGEYEDILGTAVLFEEDPTHKSTETLPGTSTSDEANIYQSSPQAITKNMKFSCMTSKKLNMTRVFLSKNHVENTNAEKT